MPLRPVYYVYLLRMWRESDVLSPSRGVWRFSLEDPVTHHRYGFADLEAVMAHLREKIEEEERARVKESVDRMHDA